MDHSDVIAEFCGITGASHHIAENYLAAHEWELERSIDFYFQHPPGPDDAAAAAEHGPPALQNEPVAAPVAMDDDDDELRRALAASMQTDAAPGAPGTNTAAIEIPDDDDEDVQVLASHRARAMAARQEAEQMLEGTANVPRQLLPRMPMGPAGFASAEDLFVRGQSAAQLAAAAGRGRAVQAGRSGPGSPSAAAAAAAAYGYAEDPEVFHDPDDDDYAPYQPPYQPMARHRGTDTDLPDLPEGINVEEARMLEAALLGVPYQGRVPDWRQQAAAGPVAPEVQEQRLLRREQDWEYEEALRLDREKKEAAEQAQREQEEQQRQQQEAEEAEEQRKREEEQKLQQSLDRKQQILAPEPTPSDPDYASSFTILVRLPDGSRKGRRFRPSDPLHNVFDYVDLASQGQGLRPHSYRLVMQFPRRVFTEEQGGSMADNGITADQAMLVEQL